MASWLRSLSTKTAETAALTELTLYTRKYCGLCEHARDNILSLRPRFAFDFKMEDIDTRDNRKWLEKYNFEVPVLHINGKAAFMNAVPADKLAEILQELSK